MINAFASLCTKRLNMFPVKGGISSVYSPAAIVQNMWLNYGKHLQFEFGAYVQALQENSPTNSFL